MSENNIPLDQPMVKPNTPVMPVVHLNMYCMHPDQYTCIEKLQAAIEYLRGRKESEFEGDHKVGDVTIRISLLKP